MSKSETLFVPKELADWITEMHGENISSLRMVHLLYEESGFEQETDAFIYYNEDEIIEVIIGTRDYEIVEPLVYALVKGWKIVSEGVRYWNWVTTGEGYLSFDNGATTTNHITKMTESEWNKLGVSTDNADFVKVEEVK